MDKKERQTRLNEIISIMLTNGCIFNRKGDLVGYDMFTFHPDTGTLEYCLIQSGPDGEVMTFEQKDIVNEYGQPDFWKRPNFSGYTKGRKAEIASAALDMMKSGAAWKDGAIVSADETKRLNVKNGVLITKENGKTSYTNVVSGKSITKKGEEQSGIVNLITTIGVRIFVGRSR